MNKHSKTFKEKQIELAEKEAKIRHELDLDSQSVEKKTLNFLKTTVIVMIGLGVVIWLFRLIKRGKSQEVPKTGKKAKKSNVASAKNTFMDSLSRQVVSMASNIIISFVQSLVQDKERKGETKDS